MLGLCIVPCTYRYYRNHKDICAGRVHCPADPFFAETFVVDFRDRPIMIWDVLAVRTAMTVSGNYEFDVTKQMIQAAKAVIGANMILWFFPVHVKGLKNGWSLAAPV